MQVGAVYIVDGTGTLTGTNVRRSIWKAADDAQPGATIRVLGMTDGMGNPVAYSDNPQIYGTQVAEDWPIELKAGCKLVPYDPSIPVYIWSTSPTGGDPLIDVVDTNHNPAATGATRIEGMRIAAGETGIRVHHNTGSWTILIKDCIFAHLEDGVDAMATGVTTSLAIRGCQIRDDALQYAPSAAQPQTSQPSRGILLRSEAGTVPGVLLGEVTELTTTGSFLSMAPAPWHAPDIDLQWAPHSISAASRLIEVFPGHGEHEYPNLWNGTTPTYARNQVPEVRLTINGGDLDGGASAGSGGGWDVGLYAHANGVNDSEPYNYESGFEVTTYGTTFRNFALSGIVGATYGEGRGEIDLRSNTRVRDSGPGQSPVGNIFNGIHMFAMESYIALTGSNFQSDNNAGNGIWLNFGGEHFVEHGVPEGVFVGIQSAASHANGRHGIAMASATAPEGTHPPNGAVGGTTHDALDGGLHRVKEQEGFVQEFGTGFINGCAISNNGLAGIYALITGIGFSSPNAKCATASARLTNNAIWNNNGSGVVIEFDDGISGNELNPEVGGLCLLPITHNTIVNNSPWSMEVDDYGTTGGVYEVDNSPYDQTILRTRVFNSILFRDYQVSPGQDDFGTRLRLLAQFDDNTPVPADRIGMAGNRATVSFFVPQGQPRLWNESPSAFFGPVVLTDWSMKMFALDSAAGSYGQFNNSTPTYLNVHAPESATDFQGTTRPAPSSGLRDKGIAEHP